VSEDAAEADAYEPDEDDLEWALDLDRQQRRGMGW